MWIFFRAVLGTETSDGHITNAIFREKEVDVIGVKGLKAKKLQAESSAEPETIVAT